MERAVGGLLQSGDVMNVSDIVMWDGVSNPRPSEVWAPIAGFESSYLVSSFGRVLRISGGKGTRMNGAMCRLRSPGPNSKGYLTLRLFDNARKRTASVHILVLETFEGPAPEDQYGKYEGHHIKPEEKTNNRLSNLAWVTAEENRAEQWHRYLQGQSDY